VPANSQLTYETWFFPRLLRIYSQRTGKSIVREHTFTTYSPTAYLFYTIEQNKDALQVAVTTFLCMRKTYPLMDKNILRMICSMYIECEDRDTDYDYACKKERAMQEMWKKMKLKPKLTKKRDAYNKLQEKKKFTRERIKGLKRELTSLDTQLICIRLEYNKLRQKAKHKNEILANTSADAEEDYSLQSFSSSSESDSFFNE
jgi:hypothetical protein